MATLAELANLRTTLDEPAIDHLLRLTASWSLLADLSFSDLLMMACVHEPSVAETNFVVLGQMRPNNRSTILNDDLVGTTQRAESWPLVQLAFENGTRMVGEVRIEGIDDVVPVWCVPVRYEGRIVAVMVRLQGPLRGPASLYEQAYLSIFVRLCAMVADSTFPYREDDVAGPGLPRVGDGIILLDAKGEVEFATPNAANALHRLGIYASSEGRTLPELGLRVRVVDRCLEYGIPALEEVDRGHDVAILFHCVPLLEHGLVTGVILLVRDVSDLRQLNRVVLNKEAAVR
ncbi:MAG TPA: histidine kinase N-terminal domain-containing protein, partial [Acidimicrobiales bacterium]